MYNRYLIVLGTLVLTCLLGCAKARIVEMSPDGGVVAIPANTNSWPFYYRNSAEELIQERCPEGFEIVREEEVVTGQVAHTQARTKHKQAPSLDLGKIPYDEKDPDNKAATLAGLNIPLGKSEADTNVTTRTTDVKEYRIHFRPKLR